MFTIHQILLCGVLYWLAEANLPFVTLWTLQKPLVCGWAAGLILGAPAPGAACGAILSMILLGFSSAGSSMPVDLALAGITGAALTSAGWAPYAAVLPALLAGSAGKYIWKLRMHVNVYFARNVRALVEKGKTASILVPAILLPALFALIVCFPVSTAVLLLCDRLARPGISASSVLNGLITSLSSSDGIPAAAAGLLPAGGLAAALTAAGYGKYFSGKKNPEPSVSNINSINQEDPDEMDPDETDPDFEELFEVPDEMNTAQKDMVKEPDEIDSEAENTFAEQGEWKPAGFPLPTGRKKTARLLSRFSLLKAALLWLLFLHICYNNEWMMGQIMAAVFLPLVRQLCPGDREGQRTILLRQGGYFNTHCECGACIPGLMASMEEELASSPGKSSPGEDQILMVRSSLMGVCGALGDTLFQKHMIPLLLTASCLLTAVWTSHQAGPLLYTLTMTILSFGIGLRSFFTGYNNTPMQLLQKLEKNEYRTAEKVMRTALGLLSVPASLLFVRFPFRMEQYGGLSLEIMSYLSASALPGAISSVLLTVACVAGIRKLHLKKGLLFLLLMIAGASIHSILNIYL